MSLFNQCLKQNSATMYNLYKYLFSFFSMMSLQLGYSQVRQDSFHNEGNIIIYTTGRKKQ